MARRRTATAELDDFSAPAPGLEDKPKRRIDKPADEGEQPRRVDGWEAVEELFTGNSDIDRKKELRLKLEEDQPLLVKFVTRAPFDVLASHWLDEAAGRKMFRCLGEKKCPICTDLDDNPRRFAVFHVAVWDPQRKTWNYRVWEVGSKLMKKLKALAKDERKGPLDNPKLYIEASRTGKGLETEYSADPIREGDAKEEWECEPLRGDALEAITQGVFTSDWMEVEKPETLREVVDGILKTKTPSRGESSDDGWGDDDEPPF